MTRMEVIVFIGFFFGSFGFWIPHPLFFLNLALIFNGRSTYSNKKHAHVIRYFFRDIFHVTEN